MKSPYEPSKRKREIYISIDPFKRKPASAYTPVRLYRCFEGTKRHKELLKEKRRIELSDRL
jgi:hypothetical protein